MRRKSRIIVLFALALLLLIPGMAAEAKTKPKLVAKKKTITTGQTYKLKLNGVPSKAKVQWKTSKNLLFPLQRKREILLP